MVRSDTLIFFIMKSLPCCITGYSFWLRVEEFFESLLFRLTPPGQAIDDGVYFTPAKSFLEKREKLEVYCSRVSRQSERAPFCVNLWLSVRLFVVWTRMKKHWAVLGSSEPFFNVTFQKLEAARCCVCRSDLFSDTAYNLELPSFVEMMWTQAINSHQLTHPGFPTQATTNKEKNALNTV